MNMTKSAERWNLSRSNNAARWFCIVLCGVVGLIAIFDSFTPHPEGYNSWEGRVFGIVLLGACSGFVLKRRYGPVLYIALSLWKFFEDIRIPQSNSAIVGASVGVLIPLTLGVVTFRAFNFSRKQRF